MPQARKMKPPVIFLVVLVVCALLLSWCGARSPAPTPLGITYTLTDVGVAPYHLVGGDIAVPNATIVGLNSYGQMVGDLNNTPFFWTPTTPNGTTGALVDLSVVLQTPCSVSLEALNAYGQVAGVVRPTASGDCTGNPGTARVSLDANRAQWHLRHG